MRTIFWQAEVAGGMNGRTAESVEVAIAEGVKLMVEFGLGRANGKIFLSYSEYGDSFMVVTIKNNKIAHIDQ